ncbi:MAG: L,D-transpeptidase family protein [Dichotomicrobium sp.]
MSAPEPLKIYISLNKQRMKVYRGTEQLFTSRVSTGKRGYATPPGVYSILEKRRWHRSNIYSGAPMPFMQRITWSGIALHASGHVPGYPASHGCVRLPRSFASKLFGKTEVGAHVIITREETEPRRITHGNLLQPAPLELVTMDTTKALRQRLAFEKGNHVSIALPARAHPGEQYAALHPAQADSVMSDAITTPPEPMTAKEGALLMADLEYDMTRLESYVTRSEEPLRILVTRRVGQERIRDVQMLLKELGYEPGPIDGYMGRQTSAAIREYQKAHGLKETGAFSEELRDKLFLIARGEPAPTGHLYVRQGFKKVFDVPVVLRDPDKPLGTHVYFAQSFKPTDTRTQWLGTTMESAEGTDAAAALERVEIPKAIRTRLEWALTPGSSLIISDEGLGRETGRGTDFIVQPG